MLKTSLVFESKPIRPPAFKLVAKWSLSAKDIEQIQLSKYIRNDCPPDFSEIAEEFCDVE